MRPVTLRQQITIPGGSTTEIMVEVDPGSERSMILAMTSLRRMTYELLEDRCGGCFVKGAVHRPECAWLAPDYDLIEECRLEMEADLAAREDPKPRRRRK